jgi:hypothetical protein
MILFQLVLALFFQDSYNKEIISSKKIIQILLTEEKKYTADLEKINFDFLPELKKHKPNNFLGLLNNILKKEKDEKIYKLLVKSSFPVFRVVGLVGLQHYNKLDSSTYNLLNDDKAEFLAKCSVNEEQRKFYPSGYNIDTYMVKDFLNNIKYSHIEKTFKFPNIKEVIQY